MILPVLFRRPQLHAEANSRYNFFQMQLFDRLKSRADCTATPGDRTRDSSRDTDFRVVIGFDECLGGDKRPTLRNSLVSGDPDLARGSEVFYYSSAGFLTVW